METFTEWDWKFNILIWSTTPPPVSRKFDQCRVEFSCGSEYENSVPGPPATAGQWHDKASHPAPSQGTDTRHVSDQNNLYFFCVCKHHKLQQMTQSVCFLSTLFLIGLGRLHNLPTVSENLWRKASQFKEETTCLNIIKHRLQICCLHGIAQQLVVTCITDITSCADKSDSQKEILTN